MPIYEYQCSSCQNIEERIEPMSKITVLCPKCGSEAKRIISTGSNLVINENPQWLHSVVDVTDKDSKESHVVQFRKNPTRENYQAWMKGEGLRHLESGERPSVHETSKQRVSRITDSIMKVRMKRKALTLNG